MTQWLALNTDVETAGWTSSPNRRGTFDILLTCVQTIALCAWSAICINVPAPEYGSLDMLRDKFHFVLLTLVAPELIFALALAQFRSARASVKQFHSAEHNKKYKDWTLIHGFYADMGAIHVRDPEWKSFPVNAAQLYYLVNNGYLTYPKLDIKDIKARGKADRLGRIITVGQTLYFAVSTFARLQQGLCITTLELTTLGFILPSLASTVVWWYKPNDIDSAQVFDLNVSVEDILKGAGKAGDEIYRNTPLDFVDHNEWLLLNLWTYYVNILRQLNMFPAIHQERPIQRIPSFNFPKPKSRYTILVLACVASGYGAMFFGAWDFYFPTRLEQLLWRIFCSIQMTLILIGASFELLTFNDLFSTAGTKSAGDSTRGLLALDDEEKVDHHPHDVRNHRRMHWLRRYRLRFREIWYRPCSNSPQHCKRLALPFGVLTGTTVLVVIYCTGRLFLIVDDLASLRSLPTSAYITPDWTRYIPWW